MLSSVCITSQIYDILKVIGIFSLYFLNCKREDLQLSCNEDKIRGYFIKVIRMLDKCRSINMKMIY